MKPSEVVLDGDDSPFPFINTFGRVEHEYAAAMIVQTCRHHGDEFGFVTKEDMSNALNHAIASGEPWRSWARNPFLRPDIVGLVKSGAAEWDDADTRHAIRLTGEALRIIKQRWSKSPRS